MTCKLLAIKFVPRHSYTSDSLYLDGKNRAVLRSLRPQTGPASKRDTTQRPPFPQQRLLFFIAGPLAFMRWPNLEISNLKLDKYMMVIKARMLTIKSRFTMVN